MNAHENAEEAGDSQPIAGVRLPRVVFGSSSLGNLFEATSDERAAEIVGEWLRTQQGEGGPPVTIDSAGKYGAGLALERLGKQLRRYEVAPEQVQISNKLGWFRVPLRGAEPTFEPGAWVGIANDAELRISKRGIVDCWEQGCELLGDPYRAQLLSVHDPDEYLASAEDAADRKTRRRDLFAAYESLAELKARGEAAAVGVGAKDWRVCKEVADEAPLDWVMIANSLT
ncbi:MAG: aldo/keto reductase, partial [Planctomycetota bacterium]